MELMGWVAIIGAAAWVPQIITWVCKAITKPKVTLYADKTVQIGYTSLGPIFNLSLALLSERKDVILNKIYIKLKHENGASYIFDWDGLSEDLSEIEYNINAPVKIRKTYLPLVVKILHTNVAQVFVRFQHNNFKINSKKPIAKAVEKHNYLLANGKLKTEEQIDKIISEPEFGKLMEFYASEFIWNAGKYTAILEFNSPNKFKYKKQKCTFSLNQADIDALRNNFVNIKNDTIESVKFNNIPGYEYKTIPWLWRRPELTRQ